MPISIGLDLSLVKSGVVILSNGVIIKQQLVRSKPVGDRPIDELKRIQKIVNQIKEIIQEGLIPDVAVIENMAFMSRNTTSLTQLAGLNYFVRAMLLSCGVPFYMCAPTTLKKFATGKGNSEKDHILLEAYKQYGVDAIDNNIADALFLAKIGSAIIGHEKMTADYQREVVELLKKQLI